MKTPKQIKARIKEIQAGYKHILTGTIATIAINAPRALMQISAETELVTLHWILGTEYRSKLKGRD